MPCIQCTVYAMLLSSYTVSAVLPEIQYNGKVLFSHPQNIKFPVKFYLLRADSIFGRAASFMAGNMKSQTVFFFAIKRRKI